MVSCFTFMRTIIVLEGGKTSLTAFEVQIVAVKGLRKSGAEE